jgi:hypothetical protein
MAATLLHRGARRQSVLHTARQRALTAAGAGESVAREREETDVAVTVQTMTDEQRKSVALDLKSIRHDYANFNWIMSGGDTFACEGTSYGEHEDGAWRAGVTHAGRWCDVFEVRDFLIQRCFIYLDPDYAGLDTDRYPWLSEEGRDARVPIG